MSDVHVVVGITRGKVIFTVTLLPLLTLLNQCLLSIVANMFFSWTLPKWLNSSFWSTILKHLFTSTLCQSLSTIFNQQHCINMFIYHCSFYLAYPMVVDLVFVPSPPSTSEALSIIKNVLIVGIFLPTIVVLVGGLQKYVSLFNHTCGWTRGRGRGSNHHMRAPNQVTWMCTWGCKLDIAMGINPAR